MWLNNYSKNSNFQKKLLFELSLKNIKQACWVVMWLGESDHYTLDRIVFTLKSYTKRKTEECDNFWSPARHWLHYTATESCRDKHQTLNTDIYTHLTLYKGRL